MLYSPGHDFGMVQFGTAETSNALAEQYPGEYRNVTTARALSKIELDLFQRLEELTPELEQHPNGDLMDGMIVALDMLTRFCGARKYKKRIFVITDGERETKSTPSETETLKDQMKKLGVRLNVITLDFGNEFGQEDDDDEDEESETPQAQQNSKKPIGLPETKHQKDNKKLLVDITDSVTGALFPANIAMQIYQQFKKREVASRARFRGTLDLSKDLQVGVQIYTRTREETFPTLKKYSKNVDFDPDLNQGKVELQREYTEVDDAEQNTIPQSQLRKAFYYGKQLVPVSEENEQVLKGKIAPKRQKQAPGDEQDDKENERPVRPEEIAMGVGGQQDREFKMLGFADQSSVPRHHYMAGVDVVLPVRSTKNERAFAALVQQMIETKKCMLAKLRANRSAEPKLMTLMPHISKKQPLLYMVQLPTSEDIRDYAFPSLVASTNAQRKAAADFIDALDLTKESEEKLEPKVTFNPALQYFGQMIVHKVRNPEQAD